MRYSNVGSATLDTIGTVHFDLVVTAQTAYTASDPSLNGLNGRFAQINFAANTQVDLRVRVYMSCCTQQNCAACDALSGTARSACYTTGCCCYGTPCTGVDCCSPSVASWNIMNHNCAQKDTPVVLPSTSMVGLSIFDLDTGPTGDLSLIHI